MRKPTTLLLILAAGLSCSKDSTGLKEPPPPPPTVNVIPESATVDLFDTLHLRAVVRDANGDTLNDVVTWMSASPNTVFVSTAGKVEGLARGTITITASSGGGSGTARIKVKINVISLHLSTTGGTLQVGDTLRIRDTLFTGNGQKPDDSVPTWRSSDTTKAVISAAGLVTARAQGSATISAQVDSAIDSATFTIAPVHLVTTITVTPPDTSVFAGDQVTFRAIARDAKGDTTGEAVEVCTPYCIEIVPLTLQLSDTDHARFLSCCTVLAKAGGTDTLIATSDTVVVKAPIRIAPLVLTSLTVGGNQACALAPDSIPYCWNTGHPVHLNTHVHFASISTDGGACGLDATGAAYCVGDSTVAVGGGKTFQSLSVGGTFVCGLDPSGSAWCWGQGGSGALGDSSTADSPTPVQVRGGHAFTMLSAGYDHACAIDAAGNGYCWGSNGGGMLGSGDTVSLSVVPVAVAGGLAFSSISAGYGYTCGVTSGGDAYCWGANVDFQLGTGDTANTAVPQVVAGGLKFTAIAVGNYHTCTVATGGAAYCWGDDGALGSTTTASNGPVAVSGGHIFSSIAVSSDVFVSVKGSCGNASDGIYCWGNITGRDDIAGTAVPVKVQGQP